MPQMGALDAFIPSAPAGVAAQGAQAPDSRRAIRPEPVAAPAVKAFPMSAAAKRAFPSLFDRITARPSPAGTPLEPPRQAPPAAAPALTTSPKLKAEPADRIAASAPEDDLLDIPAFLRRQAN